MKKVNVCGSGISSFCLHTLMLLAFLWIASPANAQVVVHRINAGGPVVAAGDMSYPDWAEDQQAALDPPPVQFAKKGIPSPFVNAAAAGDLTAGRNKETNMTNVIDPAAVEELMITQRWDPLVPQENMVWSFPVQEAEYKVVLYFNELFGEGIGSRKFDIYIDEVLVEDDLDILSLTGNLEKVAVAREYTVFAFDETMNIEFVGQSETLQPFLSAIELINMSSGNNAPIITGVEDQFGFEGDEVSLQIQATDPDDVDGLSPAASQVITSYTAENLPTGLSINTATGLISGQIEEGATGSYDVRIIVVDGGTPAAGAITMFNWAVSDGLPVVVTPIEDMTKSLGDESVLIDLNTVFTDPADLGLAFSVESNTNTDVAGTSINDDGIMTVSFSETTIGTAEITVRATNTLENFVDDVFSVTVEGGTGKALVQITPVGDLGQSTFNGGTLVIQNNSTSGVQISQVTIDLSNSLFPDMVWDPNGEAGDSGAKCVTPNEGATEVGYVAPADECVNPFTLPNEGGFYGMTLNFDDFDEGEVFTFSVDADPTSIKGNPNVGDAGSVSGIELMGSEVTVQFSNGSTFINDLFRVADSNSGSEAVLVADPVDAPQIVIDGVPAGVTATTVTDANQNITVSGPAGANVRLVQLDGRLNLTAVPGGGFDIEPFEANEAIGSVWEYTAVIEGDGDVSIPVVLRMSNKEDGGVSGGLNYFIAAIEGDEAGRTSNKAILELYSETAVNFSSGWNLVGLSYDVEDNGYESLFADVDPVIPPFAWDGAYVAEENLLPGKGYWQLVTTEGSITVAGSDIFTVTRELPAGWSLVSGPSCIFDIENLQDASNVYIPNTLFRYDGGYVGTDTMTPNTGYWVLLSDAGTLIFDCTHQNIDVQKAPTADRKAKIAPHASFGVLRVGSVEARGMDLYFGGELAHETLKAQYGMPPVAQGGFDVRFKDNSRLVESNTGLIRLQSDAFPVHVEMVARPDGSFDDYVIEAFAGDQVVATYHLTEGQQVQIDNNKVTGLRVGTDAMAIESLPEAFALSGNYPNPFNPTTNLVFDLPENALMQVGIYDLLGRKVMEVDAIEMAAGAGRQLQIDASSLASGTYVYRIQAEMASGVMIRSGQMTLLK